MFLNYLVFEFGAVDIIFFLWQYFWRLFISLRLAYITNKQTYICRCGLNAIMACFVVTWSDTVKCPQRDYCTVLLKITCNWPWFGLVWGCGWVCVCVSSSSWQNGENWQFWWFCLPVICLRCSDILAHQYVSYDYNMLKITFSQCRNSILIQRIVSWSMYHMQFMVSQNNMHTIGLTCNALGMIT